MRPGSTGMCPHCDTGVRFEKGMVNDCPPSATSRLQIRVPSGAWLMLEMAGCPICGQPILDIETVGPPSGGQRGGPGMIYPRGKGRPLPAEFVRDHPDLAADFAEAVDVLSSSRKASAAISRRCLQIILSSAGGAKKRDLADQIDEVLSSLPAQLAENVDAIRQVGNFAAHPMKSTSTGTIVDVEDGEAEWLLDVLEELVDYFYVTPARAAERRDALNRKLASLGKPPLKAP
jgi:hypothetical protein